MMDLICRFYFTSCLIVTTMIMVEAQSSSIKIQGHVVEEASGQPIEYATIMLGSKETKQAITGTTTGADGNFELETNTHDFFIEISFIGFVSSIIEEFNTETDVLDLGTIALSNNIKNLKEVVVRAEKSSTEFKLDKRVFNVGKDLSNSGASALEVLNNVPSVNVSIEGDITLRGSSGVQILVNGKPSVLASDHGNALGTLTADMLERIEVITNPSAKYDAEGTSGIINIVIKKEEKIGVNGSITLNTGIPNNHSLGVSLNRRTEKFNLFTQMGVGHRTFPGRSDNINRNLTTNEIVNSEGDSEKNETFYNLILGTDYHIDRYNVLSLSGHFAYELESEYADTEFETLDGNRTLLTSWNRDEETTATNPKYQYELQYKRDFKDDEDHTLLFSALGHFFGKDQSSDFENIISLGILDADKQRTRTDYSDANYTFKLDYTKPLSEKITLETGTQYLITDVANDYAVTDLIQGEWIETARLSNVFEFDQNVLGVYTTGAYEGAKWGLKLGLRWEGTQLNTLLVNDGKSSDQNYTNFFPSAHTSYKLSDNLSLQAGYSKRIYRPRMRDLNPYFNIRNNFSIRTGNPALQPELTDSYEITSIYVIGNASFNVSVYHRHTIDVVERVSTFDNGVSTSRPENIGENRATGIEFNAKYTPIKWLVINGDFNFNVFQRKGSFEETLFDFNADQWSSRLMGKIKLPAQVDLELTGNYQSREQTFQSQRSGYAYLDLGMRKKIMKGRTILNLSVRDVFSSRIMETETNQPSFYLYSWRQRGGRFVTLGFSYGFGKGEAMEFSGQKRF